MSAPSCAAAVHEAIGALEWQDSGSWCTPLVHALESRRPGSSVEWCADLLIRCIDESDNLSEQHLKRQWIQEIQSFVLSPIDSADLHKRSRAIWYHGEERDEIQTAIAKVYEATAAYLNGDIQRYRRGIAFTISHVILADVDTSTDIRFQRAVELFWNHCQDSADDVKAE